MVEWEQLFPDGLQLTWETDNPLAYFNVLAFLVGVLILRRLAERRADSGLARGAWNATWALTVGTGLHFLGDVLGVSELWDHQFIHFVLLVAVVLFFIGLRQDD